MTDAQKTDRQLLEEIHQATCNSIVMDYRFPGYEFLKKTAGKYLKKPHRTSKRGRSDKQKIRDIISEEFMRGTHQNKIKEIVNSKMGRKIFD